MVKISIAVLKRQGFDKSYYDRSSKTLHARCSQCEACIINGVPCHERNCPNKRSIRK